MGEYMIEKLANLAEECIEGLERDQEKEISDNSEDSGKKKKNKKKGFNISNLLRDLFNNDKFFDFSVVMFVRTMMYDCTEVLEKKKRDMIQGLCQDVGSEIAVNDKNLKLMATMMHAEMGYFRNQEDYGSFNKKERDNSCIQLFVEVGEDTIPVYSIAYTKEYGKVNR